MSTAQKEQTMSMGQALAAELTQEAIATRKMLERLPSEKLTWQPHEKSMTVDRLAGHIIEMIGWTGVTLANDELDFSTMDYTPKVYTDSADMVADFDKNIADAVEILNATPNETFGENWTMRNGEQVYFTMPKAVVMRGFVLSHIIHHRGQLSVYLRLLDIPVPSIYGPSADEGQM
jgi:uncharacterized damage-inducible protein DinB